MWTYEIDDSDDTSTLRYIVRRNDRPASFEEVLLGWQGDEAFRERFNSWLAECPFPAFRWETPPTTASTLDRPFEFAVLDSIEMARHADPAAFAEHFECAGNLEVLTFPNLGGDAMMIVPCPRAEPPAYGHIATFSRIAPESQRHALWQAVGAAMAARVSDRPVWLSTAGAGVSWLHIRLDDQPKYYGFDQYKKRF